MWYEQTRGSRGRFARTEAARERAQMMALARLVGETALAVRPSGEELSVKELRVLLALARGEPIKEIAKTASAFSVSNLRKRTFTPIRQKLGAINMPHAVRRGFEEELLYPESIRHLPRRDLSDTQKEVLGLISLGASHQDVCLIMDVAPNTVTSHVADIRDRYGVKTDEHATGIGLAIGDVPYQRAA